MHGDEEGAERQRKKLRKLACLGDWAAEDELGPRGLTILRKVFSGRASRLVWVMLKALTLICVVILWGCKKESPWIQCEKQAVSACVTISTIDGSGSGFFARFGNNVRVLTCRHVVEEEPILVIRDTTGRKYPVLNVQIDETRDIAVVDVDFGDQPLPLAYDLAHDVSAVALSDEVLCYGDSQGLGVIVECQGKMLGIGASAIEVDAPFVQGNSGGPVVRASTYSVVGVASFMTHFSEGSKWVSGTRFEKSPRHFAVRVENPGMRRQCFRLRA